jgi:hypothetical protein
MGSLLDLRKNDCVTSKTFRKRRHFLEKINISKYIIKVFSLFISVIQNIYIIDATN